MGKFWGSLGGVLHLISESASQYHFGPFHLDPEERILLFRDRHIPLPPKVFDTLLALVLEAGHNLEKDVLMQRIWPDHIVEEVNLAKNISDLRKVLAKFDSAQDYIQTVPRHGYRFIASVTQSRRKTILSNQALISARALNEALEPVGGAMPLESGFYVVRSVDAEFSAAISRQDGTVLLKGPRQVGKSSLLARGLQQARETGSKVVLTDLQRLNASDLLSAEQCLQTIAEFIAARLQLDFKPHEIWDSLHSPNFNFEQFWYEALSRLSEPVVWGLDEVDRLFGLPFAGDIFGLFRSWHNARALEPEGPWSHLTLVMAYATEAHLFISDLNQSPFNVGTRLSLSDFTAEQVADLNRRCGTPLRNSKELATFFRLVGGNPYLVRRGLYEMKRRDITLDGLQAELVNDAGPFGDHLRRTLTALTQDQTLCQSIRGLLRGDPIPSDEMFYRLKSAGILTGDSARNAQMRCELYAAYLEKNLKTIPV